MTFVLFLRHGLKSVWHIYSPILGELFMTHDAYTSLTKKYHNQNPVGFLGNTEAKALH